MAEEVTIYVLDQTPPGELINGVYVALHDYTTKALLQFDYSGAGALTDGQIIFSNVDPDDYEIRIVPVSPVGVKDGKIQKITVLASPTPPDSNIFDVLLTQEGLEVAANPNLCRCSGFFVDMTGKALPDVSVHITDACLPQMEQLASGNYQTKAIVPSRRVFATDSAGFLSVDLYRGQTYGVYMEGWENVFRWFTVPDAPAANFIDILFPYVSLVQYYESGNLVLPIDSPSVAVTIGVDKEIEFEVVLKNGNIANSDEVTFSVDDDSILEASVSYRDSKLTLKGVSAGVATVSVERVASNDGVTITPVPELIAALSVTVS
jgi:hypothetical protein